MDDAFDCLTIANDGYCHQDDNEIAPMYCISCAYNPSLTLTQLLEQEHGLKFLTQVIQFTQHKLPTESFQLKGVDEPNGFRFYLYYEPPRTGVQECPEYVFESRTDTSQRQHHLKLEQCGHVGSSQSSSPCISCKSDNEFVRLLSKLNQQDDMQKQLLIGSTSESRIWLDRKLRPMIVATPKYHAVSLFSLSPFQICDLYRESLRQVSQHFGGQYLHMRVNHGDWKNVAHIHLKVEVLPEIFRASHLWRELEQSRFKELLEHEKIKTAKRKAMRRRQQSFIEKID